MYSWRVTVMNGTEPGPMSALETFFTGPYCSEADRASYSPAVLLRPFDGEIIRSTIHLEDPGGSYDNPILVFEWDDPTACLPTEGYGVEISRDPTFRRADLSPGSIPGHHGGNQHTSAMWFWAPGTEWHDCERYYWRVLTGWPWTSTGGTPDPPYSRVYAVSETWSFVLNTSGMICPLDGLRIITPFPAITLPPEGVPGPGTPMADVKQPANCRSGPGMDYVVLDLIAQGTSLLINGRNQASTWWQVLDANIQRSCWLALNVADVSGETSGVPVIAVAPPAATDTPVPVGPGPVNCAQYTSNTCPQHADACRWDPKAAPGGKCVNK
jgi:uncharacterized protein YraI